MLFVHFSPQLFDRSGFLYAELLRFVLRLLGFGKKSKKVQSTDAAASGGQPLASVPSKVLENSVKKGITSSKPPPRSMPGAPTPPGGWDSVWSSS